jgi:hypothetical protein
MADIVIPPISLTHSPASGEDQTVLSESCRRGPVFLNDSTASVEDACHYQPLCRTVLGHSTFLPLGCLRKSKVFPRIAEPSHQSQSPSLLRASRSTIHRKAYRPAEAAFPIHHAA